MGAFPNEIHTIVCLDTEYDQFVIDFGYPRLCNYCPAYWCGC